MYSDLMSETSGDVIRFTRAPQKRNHKEEADNRNKENTWRADGLYLHWMFVVHDRKELVNRQHLP